MKQRSSSLATRAVHAGAKSPASVTVPKVPPIYASSVFSFDYLDQIDEVYEGKSAGYVYSRQRNPGIDVLEETVRSLEDGAEAVAFSSGMAAIICSILALVSAGDHVVASKVLYGGTYTFLHDDLPKRGVEATLVDTNDLVKVRKSMKPNTKVLYCETISNPTMEVADLAGLAEIAHSCGALLIVDNTFASPVLCRPLAYGADISIHSATKYLNGHSDVTGGVAVFSASMNAGASKPSVAARVRSLTTLYGPVLSPIDAWLLVRGIRTIDLRVRKCSENALRLAEFLAAHPKVTVVNYPGLETSPFHALGEKYLDGGFGGMLSFEVRSGCDEAKTGAGRDCEDKNSFGNTPLDAARKVIDSLRMVELVPSLAGVSTTVSHPGKTSHRAIPLNVRELYGVGDGLIRVSAGIEDYRDIEADFRQALSEGTASS